MKRANAALIHAHFAPDGAAALTLADTLRVPLIVTLHGYDVTTGDEHLAKSLAGKRYLMQRQRLWRAASRFVCVSQFIYDSALKMGFPKDKLKVHYIGIDGAAFAAASRPVDKLVLFVGRLVQKKGVSFLLRAMRLVQGRNPAAQLVIIGGGPLRQSLEAEAKELGVRCRFLGAQPGSVVKSWLEKSTLLCIPSVIAPDGDAEGLGMVILEAGAMGRPVVGFSTGGIPEAVQDLRTGLLAPAGDFEALAANIQRFLEDEDFWRHCSAEGIERVRRQFDLHTQTRQLEAIYSEAIGSEGRESPPLTA